METEWLHYQQSWEGEPSLGWWSCPPNPSTQVVLLWHCQGRGPQGDGEEMVWWTNRYEWQGESILKFHAPSSPFFPPGASSGIMSHLEDHFLEGIMIKAMTKQGQHRHGRGRYWTTLAQKKKKIRAGVMRPTVGPGLCGFPLHAEEHAFYQSLSIPL